MKTQSFKSLNQWTRISDGSVEGFVSSDSPFFFSIGASSNVESYHTAKYLEIKRGMGVYIKSSPSSFLSNIVVSTFKEDEVIKSVQSISLSDSTAMLEYNKTKQLTATVLPADATDKSVIWTSSDETIATVSSSGLVSSKQKTGNAVITAKTSDGGFTSTCAFNVIEKVVPVTAINVDTNGKNMPRGTTYQIEATVSPADATDKTLTYTSNDPSITVGLNTGLVTAVLVNNVVAEVTITASSGISVKKNFLVT